LNGQKKGGTVHVWDEDLAPAGHDGITLLWSGFAEKENSRVISLPKFVEENALSLRGRYLAWIYELGEMQVNGKRIVDHLEIRSGLSYWWMTVLSEKSIFKSPHIFDVIKLFALEDIQKEIKPVKIILTSADKKMAGIFKTWCSNINVEFEWHRLYKEEFTPSDLIRVYRSLPKPLLAVFGLIRHVLQKFPFSQKYKENTNNADITLIDYFINLSTEAPKSGVYLSNYWTELVTFLRDKEVSTNWLHIYVPHGKFNTPSAATELMGRFDRSSGNKEHHLMIDGVISFTMAFRIFKDYCKIVLITCRLKNIKKHFRPLHSSLDLWDLYKEEWIQGTRGTIAMASLINFNVFEKLFADIHKQKLGIFLLENQNWEIAMTYAWKKNGHERLIGVAHSTVRFWDLRYFHDARTYQQKGNNPLPMPDHVALNGPVAMNEYIQGQYPPAQLLEAEALRYFHLADKNKQSTHDGSTTGLKILVCGDIDARATHKMMQWLEEIYTALPQNTTVTVKSHPAQDISSEIYPHLPMVITREPLGNILRDYDVVYASYITSAAVDAYCSGLPVVQVLDGAAFNMSALRGLEGVTYVTDPMELAAALISSQKKESVISETYFYLDKDLPRWRGILSSEILN
jgi:surface carbohydrate biosynthesis protein (TIGR04326 family)